MTPIRRRFLPESLYWILAAALAMGVVLFFVHTPGIEGYHNALYGHQVDAQAHRPFVLRALSPFVVRTLVRLVPDSVREDLESIAADRKKPWRHRLIYLGWNPKLLPEYLVGMAVMWASLLGFVWAFRGLIRTTIESSIWFENGVPLLALALMPIYFAEYYCYLYDFPQLFLFTLGLLLLAARRWTSFLVLYPLSCLNKETTVLLTVVFLLHFRRDAILSRGRFAAWLVYQILVFAAIRFWLMHTFADRPGDWVERYFWRNVSLIQTHTHLFYALFGVLFALALVLPHRWSRKPRFLRQAFAVGPILFVLDAFYGYLDELRTYYEVYPVALLLVVFTFGEKLGWMGSREAFPESAEPDLETMVCPPVDADPARRE